MNGPEHLHICEERYAGLCDAFQEYNLEHNSRFIRNGDFGGSSGERAAVELLNIDSSITAIFSASL